MKNIFSTKETFAAYSNIEYMHFLMRMADKQYQKTSPKSPIAAAVDIATGYDKIRDKEHYQYIKECITSCIESKKILDMDYSRDLAIIDNINTLFSL